MEQEFEGMTLPEIALLYQQMDKLIGWLVRLADAIENEGMVEGVACVQSIGEFFLTAPMGGVCLENLSQTLFRHDHYLGFTGHFRRMCGMLCEGEEGKRVIHPEMLNSVNTTVHRHEYAGNIRSMIMKFDKDRRGRELSR